MNSLSCEYKELSSNFLSAKTKEAKFDSSFYCDIENVRYIKLMRS